MRRYEKVQTLTKKFSDTQNLQIFQKLPMRKQINPLLRGL